MVNKIFLYDNSRGAVELNTPEILLVREFAALLDNERNKCEEDSTGELKLRAFREFTYIWLAIDWQSIYADYDSQERHTEALKDSGITEEEFNNPEFRAACRKYRELQESSLSIRMLNAARGQVEDMIDYFNHIVDLNERDATGKPIYKMKDIIGELTSLNKVHEQLKILEDAVKKETSAKSKVRAGAVDGYMPNF